MGSKIAIRDGRGVATCKFQLGAEMATGPPPSPLILTFSPVQHVICPGENPHRRLHTSEARLYPITPSWK
jgi:hypothetical protein